MNRRLALLAVLALVSAVGILVATKASAVITLTTPAQITAPGVRPTVMTCQVPPDDSTTTQCFINYIYCDTSGNALPGFTGGVTTVLANPDLSLLVSTPGSVRAKIQAAMQNNLGGVAAGDAH